MLWIQERDRKPQEVQKTVQVTNEVPKEVIREVQVIKEVEVPAKLTTDQKYSIDFTSRYLTAPQLKTSDEVFYKMETVKVAVFLNDAVKKVVTEDRVKNKFELILRKHNIRLDDNASVWLGVTIEGLWNKDEIILTYTPAMSLTEGFVVARNGDLRRVIATTWSEGKYGYAGKNVAESAIVSLVEEMAESFANRFLATSDKEAAKESGK